MSRFLPGNTKDAPGDTLGGIGSTARLKQGTAIPKRTVHSQVPSLLNLTVDSTCPYEFPARQLLQCRLTSC